MGWPADGVNFWDGLGGMMWCNRDFSGLIWCNINELIDFTHSISLICIEILDITHVNDPKRADSCLFFAFYRLTFGSKRPSGVPHRGLNVIGDKMVSADILNG